jgi:branched-chain amino acid transport system ATP-binding protein
VLLSTHQVSRHFGGVAAVEEVSIEVTEGELAGLIGPNGAGKTTLFNLITRLDDPDAGTISLRDQRIDRLPAHRMVDIGIARTFQNIRLLSHLTVVDNVKIAFHRHVAYGLLHAIFRLPRFFPEERRIAARAGDFLEFVGLQDLAGETAAALPYGMRRKLEIARALATGAKLLLLDEPAAGMNPQETVELMGIIERINRELGLTVFLIEHDMRLVMQICRHLVVMDHGRVIARGAPAAVRRDERVIEAYLGTEREAAGASAGD